MLNTKDHRAYIAELGRKLQAYRVSMELTQQDLEDRCGVSKRSISRLEQGDPVQIDNLFKILLALGLGDNIDLLVPDQTNRPSYHLVKKPKPLRRVRKKTKKQTFRWGDEE